MDFVAIVLLLYRSLFFILRTLLISFAAPVTMEEFVSTHNVPGLNGDKIRNKINNERKKRDTVIKVRKLKLGLDVKGKKNI